jgi:two-component system response regulator FixJ
MKDWLEDMIYIIDDDQDVRASIAFMLAAENIDSRSFESGIDFMASLGSLGPACLLLDVRMPKMSGLDVLREFTRRQYSWPVIMMTGHGESALAKEALLLGADSVVEKPFDTASLLNRLRVSLDSL